MRMLFLAILLAVFAAQGEENMIWDDTPASDNWERSWYPLGNGRFLLHPAARIW